MDRAISEADVAPPEVTLTAETVLAGLKIPVKWVTRKMADAEDARAVQRMYDELQQTGTVDKTPSEDDRTIRDLHAKEVLSSRRNALRQGRSKRRDSSPLPQGDMPRVAVQTASKAAPQRQVERSPLSTVPQIKPEPATAVARAQSAAAPQVAPAGPLTRLDSVPAAHAPAPEAVPMHETDPDSSKYYLTIEDDIEAAPSIGPKTAARLEAIGLISVRDLIEADPEAVAELVGVRHITKQVVTDLQEQSKLVMSVSRLRGTHAQLLVGAGFRTAEDVADADPADLTSSILRFAQTREGQRILRDGKSPQIEKVSGWVRAAADNKIAA